MSDDDYTEIDPDDPVVKTARTIALAGTLFLVVLAVWLWGMPDDHPWRPGTILLLSFYSIAILTFLSGVRWALAFGDGEGRSVRGLLLAVIPVAAAPPFLFIGTPEVFAVLAAAFAALGAWDTVSAHSGNTPYWYGRMRMRLTLVIVASLVLAFIATS
jgi:hypothetical protein